MPLLPSYRTRQNQQWCNYNVLHLHVYHFLHEDAHGEGFAETRDRSSTSFQLLLGQTQTEDVENQKYLINVR